MSQDREDQLDRAIGAMQAALSVIANYGDCDYAITGEEKPRPCPCPQCTAKRALETEAHWRVEGAGFHRTATMPREAAMMKAWERYIINGSTVNPDQRLAQILREAGTGMSHEDYQRPSVRDWYVASTIIQWLATNVGSSVLDEAGYKYKPEE